MIRNKKAFTLVEVLAAVTLLSVVLLLAFSFYLFLEKQWDVQYNSVQNQSDVRLAMNILTKAIRSADQVNVQSDDTLIINNNDVYKLNSSERAIEKNGSTVVNGIKDLHFSLEGNKVTIHITGFLKNEGRSDTLTTYIYIRK